ncbi:MAG: Secondary metabolism regulator lae1 [Pycnora praestabilis]|nr:MAG: Secondary metabolism regulator lae1 [Pycnora praestabilis]
MATNGVGNPPGATPPNHVENGRLFHGFRKGIYMYPCDEQEKDRMDIYHKIFSVARREQLHQPKLTPYLTHARIMDLGTGTGIWAIDVADKYLGAEVMGMDLVNIQPERIPPNLRFRVPRDYESPWFLGEESWDLIHLRMGNGSVSSWPELYQKIFLHLKPGFGSMEQVEIDMQPRCDDGTLAYQPVLQWWEWLSDATQRASRPIAYQHNTRQMLEATGFVDIEETVIRLPYNSWPSSPYEKELGRWYNLGMSEGLEALSLGPLTRVYGWPAEDVRRLVKEVKKEVCSKKVHAYNNMLV